MVLLARSEGAGWERSLATAGGGAGSTAGKPQGRLAVGVGLGQRCRSCGGPGQAGREQPQHRRQGCHGEGRARSACLLPALRDENPDVGTASSSLPQQQRHRRSSVPQLHPAQGNVPRVRIWLLLVPSFIIGVSVSCTAVYATLFIKEGPVHFRDTMTKNTNIWSLSILY